MIYDDKSVLFLAKIRELRDAEFIEKESHQKTMVEYLARYIGVLEADNGPMRKAHQAEADEVRNALEFYMDGKHLSFF